MSNSISNAFSSYDCFELVQICKQKVPGTLWSTTNTECLVIILSVHCQVQNSVTSQYMHSISPHGVIFIKNLTCEI